MHSFIFTLHKTTNKQVKGKNEKRRRTGSGRCAVTHRRKISTSGENGSILNYEGSVCLPLSRTDAQPTPRERGGGKGGRYHRTSLRLGNKAKRAGPARPRAAPPPRTEPIIFFDASFFRWDRSASAEQRWCGGRPQRNHAATESQIARQSNRSRNRIAIAHGRAMSRHSAIAVHPVSDSLIHRGGRGGAGCPASARCRGIL